MALPPVRRHRPRSPPAARAFGDEPRAGAAPAPADDHERVPRRGDLHLRRRRRRAGGRAARRSAATRTSSSRPTSPVEPDRPRPVRPRASSTATPRSASWSPAGCRCTGFVLRATSSASYDLDRADGRVDARCASARRLVSRDPRPVQGRCVRPRRSPGCSASTRGDVQREVRRAANRADEHSGSASRAAPAASAPGLAAADPRDPRGSSWSGRR